MYQQSVIMQGVCTSTFENEYSYPTSWIHGSNRQSPPPPLVTKQEQPMGFKESTNALIPTMPSCANQHQYYYPVKHQTAVSASSTPTWNGEYYSGHQSNTMCQPLIMDDYASNVSSPDLTNGPLVLPPSPDDVLSSTSSPTIDDQWMDLCSPTTHSSYYVEQRHSFDDTILFTTNTNNIANVSAYIDAKQDDGVYYYHSGNNAGASTGNNMMSYYQMNSTVPSPTASPSSSSSSAAYQPAPMMIARHHSVPSLYHPHHHPHSHHYRHHHHQHQHLQHQHPIPSSTTVASDVRPYQCHICSRSFARKHDLQRHVRVHTGDKPYTCLCCKKAFARTDALKRHLRMEEACRNSPQVQAMKITGKRRYKNL